MADTITNEPLEPSQLGTKDYWDSAYTTELNNFNINPTDIGTIWFSDSAAEEKILSFLTTKLSLPVTPVSWLDLGTGNGHLIFALREVFKEDGREGDMFVGVDYSERSVELAKVIAAGEGIEEGEGVKFVSWDIMSGKPEKEWMPEGGFDFVLDKGTFDAISLSEELDEDGRRVFERYPRRVAGLLKSGGMFLITSCNWTEQELRGRFEGLGDFIYHDTIKYPTFSFGGKKGQTISSVCFRRTELDGKA